MEESCCLQAHDWPHYSRCISSKKNLSLLSPTFYLLILRIITCSENSAAKNLRLCNMLEICRLNNQPYAYERKINSHSLAQDTNGRQDRTMRNRTMRNRTTRRTWPTTLDSDLPAAWCAPVESLRKPVGILSIVYCDAFAFSLTHHRPSQHRSYADEPHALLRYSPARFCRSGHRRRPADVGLNRLQ